MPSDTILCMCSMYMYFLFLYKKCLYYATIVEKMKLKWKWTLIMVKYLCWKTLFCLSKVNYYRFNRTTLVVIYKSRIRSPNLSSPPHISRDYTSLHATKG